MTVVDVSSCGAVGLGLAGQPVVEVGPVARWRRCTAAAPHASVRKSTVSAWVVGQHHRRAAGDPALDRRLLPPLRVQPVEDARVDDAAVHVLAAGERAPLEQQHRAPGAGEHGRRARAGRTGADDDDVVVERQPSTAPEPRGELVEDGVGVGDDGQVGHLHHRAVRVGVDADDVVGRAEPGGVLHGAADAEREVQVGVDDDAGRADLALVADPAAVGDRPASRPSTRRARRRRRRAGRSARRRRARRRRRRCASPRRGPSSSTSGGSTSTTRGVAAASPSAATSTRSTVGAARPAPASTPRTPGCSVATTGSSDGDVVELEAAAAGEAGARRA